MSLPPTILPRPETSDTPATRSPQDSANLDFLRACAVLLVFVVHFYDIANGAGGKWGLAWHLGQLGVLMFFVHTCLVLMWSLDRSNLKSWRVPTAFYVRRIFRLYPLSIACMLLAYCIDLNWEPANLWPNLTLTQYFFPNDKPQFPPLITPLWTLPLEVQMYVVLPALFVLCRNRSVNVLWGSWFVSVALAMVQPQLGNGFLILKYVPCFLGGVMAWRLMRNGGKATISGWLWPVAIAGVSVVWMTAASERFLPLHIAAFGLCLGLCVPLFKEIPSKPVACVARIVARYSYSIYLSHFAIAVFLFNDPANHPMFKVVHQLPFLKHFYRTIHWTMIVVLPVAVPLILYHVIEQPGIRLGQKFARALTGLGAGTLIEKGELEREAQMPRSAAEADLSP
jgi:peptidoglycan/LPS O-acetylase OafA/YrhL